ncbi:hypothetical protein M0R45_032230 [Rubus argutus]|uniref:Uncharacterized protein n=1 Tax=Rubus argutus TaxID=59490 RepID=A0AAW1WIG7_RUBAR
MKNLGNNKIICRHGHQKSDNVIKKIYKKGGRKFGISSLVPLGCVPSSRAHKQGNTGTRVEDVTELAKLHNRGLAESLQKLKRHHQGFKYSNPNFFTFLNEESTIQENMVSRKERQHAVALVHTEELGAVEGRGV